MPLPPLSNTRLPRASERSALPTRTVTPPLKFPTSIAVAAIGIHDVVLEDRGSTRAQSYPHPAVVMRDAIAELADGSQYDDAVSAGAGGPVRWSTADAGGVGFDTDPVRVRCRRPSGTRP